ncbi:MAG TPA: hypothetical protein PLY88_05285 [Candidatus Omnitrophota bacterium]|nr:hypothetical protein [Candidatus Omnitrophota bacterium]
MIDFKWLNDLILLGGATQLSLPAKTLCCMDPETEEDGEEETII